MLIISCLAGASNLAAQPAPHMLWKLGTNLPHLRWDRFSGRGSSRNLPLVVGAEFRLPKQFSLYSTVEASWHSPAMRRARRSAAPLPVAAFELGGRYYYQPSDSQSVFTGSYIGLAAYADVTQTRRRRRAAARPVPSVLLLWGTQFRPAPHWLCDFSLGGGVRERAARNTPVLTRWELAGQVNLLVYLTRH